MRNACTILLLAMAPSLASAVCLGGNPSVQAEMAKSQIVIVGRVTSETLTPASEKYLEGTTYLVVVNEALRGAPRKNLSLFSENSSGRFPMKVGKSYLLFVHNELGLWQVDNCGNSAALPAAAPVLAAARAVRK